MSDYEKNEGFFQSNYYDNQSNYGYDSNTDVQFGQEPQFGQFNYAAGPSYGVEPSFATREQTMYTGSIMTPNLASVHEKQETGGDNYDDEPPLMEELGINFDHIVQKHGRSDWRSAVKASVATGEDHRVVKAQSRRETRKSRAAGTPSPSTNLVCPLCSRCFRARIGLLRHMRTHTQQGNL